MKQCLAILTPLALVMAVVLAMTGCSENTGVEPGDNMVLPAAPSDVVGTRYEEAVADMIERGIFSVSEDGTFIPEAPVNRAEACVILVKMLGVSEAELDQAPDSGAADLEGFWAKRYIDYMVGQGVVNQSGDGSFHPDVNLSFNEFVTILVLSFGYDLSNEEVSWPQNYLNKAAELGILDAVPESIINSVEADDGGMAAVRRGDAALMIHNALSRLDDGAETGQ